MHLQMKLKTKYLGRNIFHYKEIDSTQKEIWRRININKIENGTIIYAELQNSGIGTHGRKWYTDNENNIAFSMYIEVNCDIKKLEGLTKKIAEIILDIFNDIYKIGLDIKLPNDIYCKGKKLGGILTETKVISNTAKYLVIGIGINTNKQKFAKEIENIATSISKEFNIKIDTIDFINEFCNRFEQEIERRIN